MPSSPEQVALTLAGLAYRGFHDLLRGTIHTDLVRQALVDGLHALAPLEEEWGLVWGPVTSRSGPDAFDSAAMYVVQNRREPTRYVVAIRGTNPIEASDWLFGDFWVSTTVPWPYARAADRVAVSASTALGLSKLQTMRSPRLCPEALAVNADDRPAASRALLASRLGEITAGWSRFVQAPSGWIEDHVVDRLRTAVNLPWMDLRPSSVAPAADETALDLLSFLADEARATGAPIDVTVTGHSKGGALASTVALWLKDALDSQDLPARWDGARGARVSAYAFAAPTPGNAAFADRIDRVLADDHHHLRNRNDIVTHAWQVDELERIPGLYAPRRMALEPLIPLIASNVRALDYRQARAGVTTFAGTLDPGRGVAMEFIHQHLDAYLDELGLLDERLNGLTLFF